MRRVALLALALALAACGSGKANTNPDAQGGGDAGTSDAPMQCTTHVTYDPASPVEGDTIRATATISNLGVFPHPHWDIFFNTTEVVPYTSLGGDGTVVDFTAAKAGAYRVVFDIGDPSCVAFDDLLQVNKPGANQQQWRLLVDPPPTAGAPPQERLVTINGGVDNVIPAVQIDPGLDVIGSVHDDKDNPIAAYVRFVPQGTPDVTIESFSSSAGAYDVRVQSGVHDVLVVPASETIAPARFASWTASTPQLVLPAADTISGTLLDGASKPIAGAHVALAIAGVPTTIGTTDVNGAWSVLGHAGGTVDVTVVPPDASGLPRLQVRAASLDVAQPISIQYASALATVDLGATTVRAAGVDAPGATVTFTGTIANAGSVSIPTKSIVATGVIATTVVADASGVLASQKIAKAQVSAVVATSPTVEAVVAIDLGGGAPAAIDAPAQVTIEGTIVDPSLAARPNVRVRLTPIGALAAGTLLVPAATTDANGHFSITTAPGGHYALRATDLLHQNAEIEVADVTTGDLGALAQGKALVFSGTIDVLGGSEVDAASVSILCVSCTGVDRSKTHAEAVTSSDGKFRLLVPDPGVQQ